MAKSTAAAALASLSHKFQIKIREVGSLKAQIKRLVANEAEGIAKDESVRLLSNEISRLRLRNDNLANDLMKSESKLKLAEFELTQAAGAYGRLQSHTRDVDGVLKELRGEVSNWKSMSVVLAVLGVVVGGLASLAYITQTVPL